MKTNLFCIVKLAMINGEMVPHYVTYSGDYNLTEHFRNRNVKIEEFSNMLSLYEELIKIKRFEGCKIVQVTFNEIDVSGIQKNIEKLRNREAEVKQQLDEIRTSIKTIYNSPDSINELNLDKLDEEEARAYVIEYMVERLKNLVSDASMYRGDKMVVTPTGAVFLSHTGIPAPLETLVKINQEMCDLANNIANKHKEPESELINLQRTVIDHIKSLVTSVKDIEKYYNTKYFVCKNTDEVKIISSQTGLTNGNVITVNREMINILKLEVEQLLHPECYPKHS